MFISLQSNRITKMEGLQGLVNLKELYLSHNGIEVIEGLENNVSHCQRQPHDCRAMHTAMATNEITPGMQCLWKPNKPM